MGPGEHAGSRTRRLARRVVGGAECSLAAIGVAAPASAQSGYVLERRWGSSESYPQDGQFSTVGPIAADAAGDIYAVDWGRSERAPQRKDDPPTPTPT